MDILLWAKRWHNKSPKMSSPRLGSRIVPIIILGYGKRVCWLVGGNVSIGSCLRSTFINDIQPQSHQNINLGQYRQPFYQPKPSQTPLTEFQKIQNFHFFWNRSSDCDPPRLNWQLPPMPMALKSREFLWIICVGAKNGIIKCQRWPSWNRRPVFSLSLYWGMAKGSVGWSVANVSIGSCLRSTLINIRQPQSHPNINLGQ